MTQKQNAAITINFRCILLHSALGRFNSSRSFYLGDLFNCSSVLDVKCEEKRFIRLESERKILLCCVCNKAAEKRGAQVEEKMKNALSQDRTEEKLLSSTP